MTPAGVVALLGALTSVIAFVRRPARPYRVIAQFALAIVSWGTLWFAAASSFARDGMSSLPIHMVGHILVMFMVPMGLLCAGVARSMWWLLNAPTRRRVLRWWYVDRRWHAPGWLNHPLTATLVLNAVMVASHTPRVFDAMMQRAWAVDWVMEPVFLLSGLYMFHYIVNSPPRKNHVRLRWQFFMVFFTMFEMVVLAMAMAIFTTSPWYSVMDPIPGVATMPGMGMHATSLAQAFHEQQLAAAILWICGDFWAAPCLVAISRRLLKREGSLLGALERRSDRLLRPAP